jgi:hypothetical protein
VYNANGNLSIGNSSTTVVIHYVSATGKALLSNSASVSFAISYQINGNSVLSNTATAIPQYIYIASGNIVAGGTASAISTTSVVYNASGGVVLGNTGFAYVILNTTTAGIVYLANNATNYLILTYEATGNSQLGETTVAIPKFSYVANGGCVVNGVSNYVTTIVVIATGNIVTGGTTNVTIINNYGSSGGFVLGSTALAAPVYFCFASGNIKLANSASVSYQENYFASGKAICGNAAILRLHVFYEANGSINVEATNELFVIINYEASGNAFVAGNAISILVPRDFFYIANAESIRSYGECVVYYVPKHKIILRVGITVIINDMTFRIVSASNASGRMQYSLDNGVSYTEDELLYLQSRTEQQVLNYIDEINRSIADLNELPIIPSPLPSEIDLTIRPETNPLIGISGTIAKDAHEALITLNTEGSLSHENVEIDISEIYNSETINRLAAINTKKSVAANAIKDSQAALAMLMRGN